MDLFAFELGRVRELCLAELYSVLGKENLVEMIEHFAIFKVKPPYSNENFDIQHMLQDRLGGTIKIAKIVDSFQVSENGIKKQMQSSLEQVLTDNFKDLSGKIPFAISAINIQDDPEIFLKYFLNFSKKIVKSLGFNSRFVNRPWINPTSAQIYKSRTVEKGIDIAILESTENTTTIATTSTASAHETASAQTPAPTTSTIYVAKTLSIQNIDLYSVRDYEKPFRDPRMGMLPPKLAQIMLNLADPEETAKMVFDPFCGSGTILMESLIRGKNVVGSDVDQKAVTGTIANLKWISEKLKSRQSSNINNHGKFRVFAKDAAELTLKDFKGAEGIDFSPDVIVSETYLGEPVSRLPIKPITDKVLSSISKHHESWLSKAAKILPKNAKMVICLPAYRAGKNLYIRLENFEKVAKRAGLTIITTPDKKPLIYDREDQVVAREIVVLQNSIENK